MIEKGKKPNTDVLGKLKNGQFMEGFLWLCGLWTHMVTMRVWVWSQWVQDPVLPWAVVGFRHGLYSTLLWLWCRLAAAPLIQPVACELPYTTSVTLERKKKKKSHFMTSCLYALFSWWFLLSTVIPMTSLSTTYITSLFSFSIPLPLQI